MRMPQNALAAGMKIRYLFPDNCYAYLWWGVINQTIKDLYSQHDYEVFLAKRYLNEPEIPVARRCGVDSSSIRLILKRAGLEI